MKKRETHLGNIHAYLGVPEYWQIVEVLDHTIVIHPNGADIKSGERHEPNACALAHAACRLFDVPAAVIGLKFAYIPQRDEQGRPYIARVMASKATQEAIKSFDKRGSLPKAGFVFRSVPPSERLVYSRRRKKEWRDAHPEYPRLHKLTNVKVRRIPSITKRGENAHETTRV